MKKWIEQSIIYSVSENSEEIRKFWHMISANLNHFFHDLKIVANFKHNFINVVNLSMKNVNIAENVFKYSFLE